MINISASFRVFLHLMIVLAASRLCAQNLFPIYDARRLPRQAKPSSTETALLHREVRPAARRVWRNREGCDDQFEILDVTSGAFTRTPAEQKAFLYNYCRTARSYGNYGIAIIEDGRVVAHIVYEGGSDYAIGSLPDINKNGLSEIIIRGGFSGQGIIEGGVSLIELTASGITRFGQIETDYSNCDDPFDKNTRNIAYRIYAKTGMSPTFFRDTYTSNCKDAGKWTRTEEQTPMRVDKSEIVYRRVK